jgi:HD-GYP domain-containing protein (c-di-GMP phosphodiesterase class II)
MNQLKVPINQQKVPASELAPGMYVSQLDRPWVETPFLFQGFVINDESQIIKLRKFCKHVYIDVERGTAPAPRTTAVSSKSHSSPSSSKNSPGAIPKPAVTYRDETRVEEEIETAREARQSVAEAVGNFLDSVRLGKKPEIAEVKRAVLEMEQSVLRNPDACLWLRLLKDKDSYAYAHCVDSSVLAIAFGRQLSLRREQIHVLGLGALLAVVGKMRLLSELLDAPRVLTEAEVAIVREHVAHSVAIVHEMRGIDPEALKLVATHHERHDGTGYPNGLSGDDVPLFGRMAAIVDCFDAITSDRPYATAISPHEAVRRLYDWRGHAFQDELVEQFIQVLGVYPVGTLVQLSNGEVGVVIGQNRVRRLRPKVMLLLAPDKTPLEINPIRDLISDTHDNDGAEIAIQGVLEPGTYGLDPSDFYL